jgi:membrane glycosyltransferase
MTHSLPFTPPEAPLPMPVQNLAAWAKTQERSPLHPTAKPWFARAWVFGVGLLITLYGVFEMYQVVSVGGRTTVLQWVLLGLFTVNFSWIALAFSSALLGFSILWFKSKHAPHTAPLPSKLTTRTALVMPVYNEATARTFAALQAMSESLTATGLADHFDFFILSDSTRDDAWIAEEQAFLRLRDQLPNTRIYYRHRPKNHHRKAGNIAEFVTRWGGHYDHMLVLDADSLMTADCIVRLVGAMEADVDAGIIQTLPLIVNRNTLFARVQQFAARVYGPVIAMGLAAWMGRDGNYWGHNALIRTRAFADAGGLPDLPGKPPFGGHILSHDFVEAALLRRAGWSVRMLPLLEGSYEESPPSLIDLAIRDRRWCQGNLQHIRVMFARGLKWPTRQHFATGIMSYIASPFWLLQLMVGIALVLQTTYIRPEYFSRDFQLFPVWPRFDPERALQLFAITMGILLFPKFLGLLLFLKESVLRKASGGGIRLIGSFLVEILLSALLAPVLMVIQSGSVFQILLGRDTGWNPQRRDDGSMPFADIVRRHRGHTLLGLATGISAGLIATSLFLWMSPTVLGLVLAIPLSWLSGSLAFGLFLRRCGLLVTPEESAPPPILTRTNALQIEWAATGFDDAEALPVLAHNDALRNAHLAMLPPPPPRARGNVDANLVIAHAKQAEAGSVEETQAWLTTKERFTALHDTEFVEKLLGSKI